MAKASNHDRKRAAKKMGEYHFLRALMPVLYWWFRRRRSEHLRQVLKSWQFPFLYGRGPYEFDLSSLLIGEEGGFNLKKLMNERVDALVLRDLSHGALDHYLDLNALGHRPLHMPLVVDFEKTRPWGEGLAGPTFLEVDGLIHMDIEGTVMHESPPCANYYKKPEEAPCSGSTPSVTSSDPHDE